MSDQENATRATTIIDALNHHDVARVLGGVTDTVKLVTVTFGRTTRRGPVGVRQVMDAWSAMAPDRCVEVVHLWAGTHGVTSECRFRGTHTGPWQSPVGEMAPTGRMFDVPCLAMWQITEGMISSMHHSIDSMRLLRQLGVDPLPAVPQRFLYFPLDTPAASLEGQGELTGPPAGIAA